MAPYFIDWTNYRDDFEREVGRILGRDVRVEGTARARLLPFPSVTFTDVVVAGDEPGEIAMTVDEFSMDAELAPFLSGEVLIFDMRLVRPRARVEVGPEGRVDWAMRPSSPFDPRQVTLEKVTVTDGSLTVNQQASARTITFEDIETELSARSLAGPWRVDGSLSVDGIPLALSASTGSVSEDGSMRVRISAEPQDYPLAVVTDGQVRFEGSEGRYAGTFNLQTVREGDGEGTAGNGTRQPPGNRISGQFALDHRQLEIEEFRFETGPKDDPYRAEGQARISLGAEPSFSITADGAQIRLGGADAEDGGIPGLSADERFSALTSFLRGLPQPTIPGTVAVNLPAVIVGDTTIRDISIEARPSEEGWDIDSAAATLPGRTRFESAGLLNTGEEVAFNGNIVMAVRQPSGFAAWLARDVDEAIRRLPAAGFSADVALAQGRQRFENLELIMGEARFEGVVERRSPPRARPSLTLDIEGEQLDVDGMRAFASLFVDDTGRNRLSGHDVDLELVAGPVLAEGMAAERMDVALRLRDGALEIDRLAVNGLAGANVSATGQISGIGKTPAGQMDATVVAVDLAPLVEQLAQRFPANDMLSALNRRAAAYPGLLKDAEVGVVASVADHGDASAGIGLSANGTAGGTAFSFSISGHGLPAELARARLNASFSARNEAASALYALFGLPALPLGLAGGAEVEISAAGTLADGLDTSFRFAGDGLVAGFEGAAVPHEGELTLLGHARLETGDLEPWLATAGISLPGFGYGFPADLRADIDFGDGLAVLSDISGSVVDSTVSGDLNVEHAQDRPHVTGAINLSVFDLGLPAEMVVGSEAFEGGGGNWPQTPFRQQVNAPFTANVELAADDLSFGRVATARGASMRLRLNGEGMRVSDFSARVLGGTAEGMAELINNRGTGLLSVQLTLEDVVIDELLPEIGLSGTATLNASVTADGKSVDGTVSALAGSGSATVANLRIGGLNPEALPRILARANVLGTEIDAGQVQAFAPEIVRAGTFRAGETEFVFSVANGVVRTPPLQLEGDALAVNAEASADLRDRRLTASGAISYEPGREAVVGSEPVVRFAAHGEVGDVVVEYEIEPLVQYLTQRALEREQARVEHMQALLLEGQRLRRELQYYEGLADKRAAAEAEAERLERERQAQERARRAQELQREAERQARAAEERARREREAQQAARDALEEARRNGGGRGGVERRPLSPPQTGGTTSDRGSDSPALRTENLTVERLMELLGDR